MDIFRTVSVIVKSLFVTALVIFVAALIFLGLLWFSYSRWESNFENEMLSSGVLLRENDRKIAMAATSAHDKSKKFAESTKKVDFVEYSTEEIGALLFQNTDQMLQESKIDLTAMHIIPADGRWELALKTKYKNMEMPWTILSLRKDDIESPEVFIRSISVGDLNLKDLGLDDARNQANRGYKDALTLVNESEFANRRFTNIELDVTGVVIKGEKL